MLPMLGESLIHWNPGLDRAVTQRPIMYDTEIGRLRQVGVALRMGRSKLEFRDRDSTIW